MEFFIDTNALIDLEYFRPSIFVGLWDNVYEMVEEKELLSVVDVLNELKQSTDPIDDVLTRWKNEKRFFIESGDNEEKILTEIMNDPKFEVFRTRSPDRGSWADPHLIACAESRKAVVITNETLNSKPLRKIPYVCKERNLKYMSLLDMMEYLDWEF